MVGSRRRVGVRVSWVRHGAFTVILTSLPGASKAKQTGYSGDGIHSSVDAVFAL